MNAQQKATLQAIADEAARAGRTLKPAEVVDAARDEASVLHTLFEWDDSAAAEKYREDQARGLIRVHVKTVPALAREVRAHVSVPTDRLNGGGYRKVEDVLANSRWQDQIVEEVQKRIDSLSKSYSYLPQLDGLWPRLSAVVAEYREELNRPRAVG